MKDWDYDDHLMLLLNGLGNDWKMFIRLAGVEEHEINASIANDPDVEEQKYQLLEKIVNKYPFFCWNRLKKILKLLEKDKLIAKLENTITSEYKENVIVEEEDGKFLEEINRGSKTLMFFIISKHIASCWKSISRCLGLNTDKIIVIQETYQDPYECAYQVLLELDDKIDLQWDDIELALVKSEEVSRDLIKKVKEDLRKHISSFQEKPMEKGKGLEENNLKNKALMFFIISKHIASCWESISRCLGLNTDRIKVIQGSYHDPCECAYQVLLELDDKNDLQWDDIESALIESEEVSRNLIKKVKEDIKKHVSSIQEKSIAKGQTDSDIYDMCGDPCGKCIIFNQNFSNHCHYLCPRNGTGSDRDRLYKLFAWLKFKVKVYEDKKKDEMEKILKNEALDEKNEKFHCLVVCILSHGEEGAIYTADGKLIELNEILNRFNVINCKSLENKPKIFIVDACRTKNPLNSITRTGATENDEVNTETNGLEAINADQVLFQSTSYDSPALRHSIRGSPFIQTFCEVCEERAYEESFNDLALRIDIRFGGTNRHILAMEPHYLRKKLYFKPETPFNVIKDTQRHLIKTIWNITIISHSSEKDIEELENQVEKFMVLQDKIKYFDFKQIISIHCCPNHIERMHFNDWKEKECNEYIKRYYGNVDFFLFNYGHKNDIPDGFKSFLEKDKPSFILKNYSLFKHFNFVNLSNALTFQQKNSLKRINHMDHIGFDPKRNAIYFFKISDGKTVHDIRVDIEDCATYLRMFLLLHQRELENKITCLVSFVVIPTTSLLERVSQICDNCEQYLITKEEFQNFDETLCKRIKKTVSFVNKSDWISLKDEELKEFKYDMKDIFASMAARDRIVIPNENTPEQLKHILLYPQQMEIANFNDKRVVLKGSYGSGKTIIGRLLLKDLCYDSPNQPIYYINCGTSSGFTEDMEKYVKCIDKNNNVVCLHNRNDLGNILKDIKRKHTSAEKVHLIFDEVPLDEISEKDILSFSDAVNQPPFDETFCYIICQAMSKQRSFTNNGVHFKTSFRDQEEMLKEKSAFKIKKLEVAVRNTRNIDHLVEIAVQHLENVGNTFFYKTILNKFGFQKGTPESFKKKVDQKKEDIQSQNPFESSYVKNLLAEEDEDVIDQAKKYISRVTAALRNIGSVLDNQKNQEDRKEYLRSEFTCIKHLDLLHEIEGSKPRLYFPLEKKKENWNQFEEVYLLMQCLRDLLNGFFFDKDENIILIHFEKNTPETVLKAIKLYEMMEETKMENIIFKSCLDVQGLEYKNVIIVLGIGEYHMRQYLIEAITRCKNNLAFLVVKEKSVRKIFMSAEQDLILSIIQKLEEKDLITKFNQYSTENLSKHKEQYERFLGLRPIQVSDDKKKKANESLVKAMKDIGTTKEDSDDEDDNDNDDEDDYSKGSGVYGTMDYPLTQESNKQIHLSYENEIYQMNCNPHGNCIIFNIVCDNVEGLSVRTGTEVDRKRLERLFTWLKYKVLSYNLNVQQIRQRLTAVANDSDMECDSLVVIVLSHGDNEGFYGSCGGKLLYDELFSKCDTELLKGKPKLFFVSLCQVYSNSRTQSSDSNLFRSQEEIVRDTLTQISGIDDLYCFTSAAPGSLSIREKDGMWFVQTLCDVFEKHASTHSLVDLEVKINNAVSKKEKQINIDGEIVTYKMIRNIKMNTLDKYVHFNPECTFAEFCEKNNIPTQSVGTQEPSVSTQQSDNLYQS